MKRWRGMWDLNPRGLSTTDLAGLPPTRLGQSRIGYDYNLGTAKVYVTL